jgi:hypothetical protein
MSADSHTFSVFIDASHKKEATFPLATIASFRLLFLCCSRRSATGHTGADDLTVEEKQSTLQ